MYDTVEEANQKLKDTVVMYGGEPVYVLSAGGAKNEVILRICALKNWEEKKTSDQPISCSMFDFRNLGGKLGNINFPGKTVHEALFCYRVGIRKSQQTQGLSEHNVHFVPSAIKNRHGKWTPRFDQMIGKPGIIQTFKGEYPTLKKIKALLSKPDNNIYSVAFNRKFSIRQDPVGPFYLQYKARDIGYTEDLDKFNLARDFAYLQETLDDMEGIQIAA